MNDPEATLGRLLAAIQRTADDKTLHWAGTPEPLTGGFWAQMWRVRLTGSDHALDGDLVARVMPNAEVGAHETAVQSHLADIGYPTPSVRLASGPGPALDKAWMLMDFAPGKPLLDGLSGLGALASVPRMARVLPDQLARHAAALHALDAAAILADRDGRGALLEQLTEQVRDLGRSDLEAIAEWLKLHRPPGGRSVICHGDLHPLNILTGPGGDTILDWGATRVTDPAYDIAYTRILLRYPPVTAPRPLKPVIKAAGRALAKRFVRSYNRMAAAPVNPAQLNWFTNLQTLRILTEVAVWEANDEIGDHPGHPFLDLAEVLGPGLRAKVSI